MRQRKISQVEKSFLLFVAQLLILAKRYGVLPSKRLRQASPSGRHPVSSPLRATRIASRAAQRRRDGPRRRARVFSLGLVIAFFWFSIQRRHRIVAETYNIECPKLTLGIPRQCWCTQRSFRCTVHKNSFYWPLSGLCLRAYHCQNPIGILAVIRVSSGVVFFSIPILQLPMARAWKNCTILVGCLLGILFAATLPILSSTTIFSVSGTLPIAPSLAAHLL